MTGASGPSPLLEIRDLRVEFQARGRLTEALRGVDITADAGEIVGVVGESGSGKSVTAMSVLKLLPRGRARITAGDIRFRERSLIEASDAEILGLRGRDICMIFQEPMSALNPVRRIEDQMTEVLMRHRICEDRDAHELLVANLSDMHISDPARILRSYPHELSGGLRQRVLTGMAFSTQPALIIADEPTTALDVTVQAQIVRLLEHKARETDTAIVFISHDLALVAQLCDRVYVMSNGEVVESGAALEVVRSPQHPYTQALLAALPDGKTRKTRLGAASTGSGTADGGGAAGSDAGAFSRHRLRSADRTPPGDILLGVESVTLSYPGQEGPWRGRSKNHNAVDGVSLEVRAGETLAVVGESGSGKTSLAKLVVGLERPRAGVIRFRGARLDYRRPLYLRQAIQMVFQDPNSSMNPRLPVWRLVTEPLTVSGDLRRSALIRRACELLEQVGLSADHVHRLPHEFSGGQRQRLAIARCLASEPELLVLDEPTSALDVSVQAQVLDLLMDLQDGWGLTYLFISHDLAVVGHISDRVAVMKSGKIIEVGESERILSQPDQGYTRELLQSIARIPTEAPPGDSLRT